MSTVTPFTKVYDTLWTLFTSDTNFTDVFKVGNIIKFNDATNRDVIKQNIQASDLPEVMLLASGGDVNLNQTSSTTKVVQNFSLVANTGDLRINHFLNMIDWIVLCNLNNWRTILTALTWRGLHYVKVVRVTTYTVGQSDQNRNRGIHGWSTLWNCEVEMHFSTAQQLSFAEVANTGWLSPSIGDVYSAGGAPPAAWDATGLGADYALGGSNNSGPFVSLGAGQYSQYLFAKGYTISIPQYAELTGIETKITGKSTGNIATYNEVKLLLDSGPSIGAYNASDNSAFPLVYTDKTFGSSSNLWGQSINDFSFDSDFGIALNVHNPGAMDTVSIDAMLLRVHYK